MNIDGVNTLACLSRIPKDTGSASKIYPLPHSEWRDLPSSRICARPAVHIAPDYSMAELSRGSTLTGLQCTLSKTSFPTSPNSSERHGPSLSTTDHVIANNTNPSSHT